MQIERTIKNVVQSLKEGQFTNEQSFSQGIVLPILRDLGWDVFNTNAVWPEYSTGEGRVDFALCAPLGKPKCFIEVKQQGKAEDGVKQALEYAFHTGAQFVTLTDGQTWSFYLPAEQGSYEERRVFMLDLFERSVQESTEVFHRYLEQERVASGEALDTARREYRNKNRRSAARQAIPTSWNELVERNDKQLVDLLTDAVETKAGIRPDEKDVLDFLSELSTADTPLSVQPPGILPDYPPVDTERRDDTYTSDADMRVYALVYGNSSPRKGSVLSHICDAIKANGGQARLKDIKHKIISGRHRGARSGKPLTAKNVTDAVWHGVQRKILRVVSAKPVNIPPTGNGGGASALRTRSAVLFGKRFAYGSAKEAMVIILSELAKADSTFLQRCSRHPAFRGRTRRYIAQRAADLYPDRPDISRKHDVLPGGWVVGTNLNNQLKMKIIKGAAEVAGITFGRDVIVDF